MSLAEWWAAAPKWVHVIAFLIVAAVLLFALGTTIRLLPHASNTSGPVTVTHSGTKTVESFTTA